MPTLWSTGFDRADLVALDQSILLAITTNNGYTNAKPPESPHPALGQCRRAGRVARCNINELDVDLGDIVHLLGRPGFPDQ
ncbi:MAG: hypothetical protein F4065_02380 [Rhodothermaceae bacterium]|nr:hypothetical protein [Rhodothermaceae bacterium]MXZ57458.1 hypothetical protein [Rhodothermaceae bacterium]MYB90442.1 hypothetical protein [Rhodothermaceae bacterium]MYD68251.1 hypothetical protein [Rhodothermaceae bacterium]MYG44241.1 hypothetical protein [Rhodothermaceae bacterium]